MTIEIPNVASHQVWNDIFSLSLIRMDMFVKRGQNSRSISLAILRRARRFVVRVLACGQIVRGTICMHIRARRKSRDTERTNDVTVYLRNYRLALCVATICATYGTKISR